MMWQLEVIPMKWMIRFGLFALVVGGILVFVMGNYYLVRTESGFHFIGKDGFSLEETVVDTRDWSPLDWMKNKKITTGLAKVKWENFKGKAAKKWENFSKELERELDDLDLEKSSDKAKAKIDDLRRASRKKYDDLLKRLENDDLSWEIFQKKVDELSEWTRKEIESIKKKFG